MVGDQKDLGSELGKAIRELRRRQRLTQEKLAESAGVCSDTVRRIETGKLLPSFGTFRKLCVWSGSFDDDVLRNGRTTKKEPHAKGAERFSWAADRERAGLGTEDLAGSF